MEAHKVIHCRVVVTQSVLNIVLVFFDKGYRMYFRKTIENDSIDFILGKDKTEIPTCDRIKLLLES